MRVKESPLRDLLRLAIWYPFRYAVLLMPVRAAFHAYSLLGRLHAAFARGTARMLRAKFEAHGCQSGPEDARRYFENHYVDRLHIFLYPRLTTEQALEPYVVFDNKHVLDEALASGRGVLVVQPHFGPVQITLLALALKGHNPIQIGYPTDKGLSWVGRKVAYRLRLKYEGMLPVPIISADSYIGRAFKHLKRGGVVLSTGDFAGGDTYLGEHAELPFLGQQCMMPLGPASLALRTGAVYMPTFIIPERADRFRIAFGSPVIPADKDSLEERTRIARAFISEAESYIRKYPWCWHHWADLKG